MDISKLERNLKDFKKEIEELKSCIDGKFEDLTIEQLRYLFEASDSLLSEWSYLEDDIEESISFINDLDK